MKTKILFISSNTGIGGQEVVLKRLLRGLDKNLYQKDVFITHFRGPLHDEYEKYSDNLYYYHGNNKQIEVISTISEYLDQGKNVEQDIHSTIFEKIRENNYDIIHIFNLWIIYDIILRLKRLFPRLKIITTLFVDIHFHRNLFAKNFHLMEKVQSHLWISITDSKTNTKTFPNLTVIRNGINPDIFKPAPKKPRTIAWIGRMIWAKRAHLISDIAKKLPDYHFIMVGDKETPIYEQYMKDKPTNLEIKIGLTEGEIAKILSETQYFLFTSVSEAMPLTILESMASGCCVISEEIGDIPNVISNGVNGYLIPKEINLVNWVSENLPFLDTSVSENARNTVLEGGFTEEQMIKKYEFFYNIPGTHHNQPRIAFLWEYEKFHEGHWEGKIDALQKTIAKLSRNHVVQVFAPTDKKPHKRILNGQNIHFYEYGDFRKLITYLRNFNPDMVFMNMFHKGMWEKIVRAFPDTWKAVTHFGTRKLPLWIAKDLDYIIVQQEYLRKPVADYNHFPLERIAAVPFGIKTDIFRPLNSEKKYTGIMVADFRKWVKRQYLLIEAWKNIPGRLLLLGRFDRSRPPGYHEDCMALAKELGVSDRIDFMDGVPHDEVPRYINQAKIAFLTSAWEGGSIALMEMMACGLPALVLSDCHGNVNRVRPGVDSIVAKPLPKDIAQQTIKLLNNYEQMGQVASERIRQDFQYDTMYEFYHDLIQRVMEKRRR